MDGGPNLVPVRSSEAGRNAPPRNVTGLVGSGRPNGATPAGGGGAHGRAITAWTLGERLRVIPTAVARAGGQGGTPGLAKCSAAP